MCRACHVRKPRGRETTQCDARRCLTSWRLFLGAWMEYRASIFVIRMPLAQLGSPHLALLGANLLALLAVVWIMDVYSWQEFYVREFAIHRFQDRYGFRAGQVSFRCGNTAFESTGISAVTPDGEFARMGVRAGDVPFEYHGHGFMAMYDSLVATERGHFSAFSVVNGKTCDAAVSREEVRRIAVRPRGLELAVDFYTSAGGDLPSPNGKLALVAVPPARAGEKATLWVRDLTTGEAVRVYSYEFPIDVAWATDASWIALSEWASTTKCLLLTPKGGDPLDLSALRERALPRPAGDRIGCEVFGWLPGSSLVALRTWAYDDAGRVKLQESIFFDASIRTFVRSSDVQQ